jgi:hypothetical protein
VIVSKSALQVVNLTASDKQIPVLDNVRVEADGTVVGSNREVTICISPVNSTVASKLPLKSQGDTAVTLTSDTVRDTIKFIGVDKRYNGLLEHCDVSVDPQGTAQVTLYDGKRTKALQAKPYPKAYFDYQDLFTTVYGKPIKARVLLNRKRLKVMLDTVEKICADGSDFSVLFAEFSEDGDMIVKAINRRTGQRVLGIVRGVKGVETMWLDPDEWERRLIPQGLIPQAPQTTSISSGKYVRQRRRQ